MFRKFVNALKTSRPARFALIAIIVLFVLLCIPAVMIGIPIPVVILAMLVLGFPVIIAVGGIGAAAGIAGSAISNKKSYEDISRSDPRLAELEKERGNKQMISIIFWVSTIILAVIAAALASWIGFLLVLVAGVIIYIKKIYPMSHSFDQSFGEQVVRSEINKRFGNAVYDASRGFSQEEVGSVNIVGYDLYRGSQYIEGDQGFVHFRSCELNLQTVEEYEDDDMNTRDVYTTVFQGYLYCIPLAKKVSETVYVADSKMSTDLNGRVKTGSDIFDKNMKVHAADPEAANQLLTAPVTAQILRLKETSKEPFCLVFNEDKLYAFIKNSEYSFFTVDLNKDINILQLKDRLTAYLAGQAAFLNGMDSISAAMAQ
ncbi:MAG: DUF3137 domain-containing protein [Lachnospiraceae bacterium]|nr:DUF3137 domain-containing protein [Lachnospiraceae bacterium]